MNQDSDYERFFTSLSEYYRETLTDGQVIAYAKDLKQALPNFDLYKLYGIVKSSWDKRYCPLPVNITNMLKEQTSVPNRQVAIDYAGRVQEAVRKYGWCNGALARKDLGEDIWAQINRYSWSYICQNLGTPALNTLTFNAQFRDMCEASMNIEDKYGKKQNYIESSNNPSQKQISDVLKGIVKDLNDL